MNKTFYFWIRRTHGGKFEKIAVQAADCWDAVNKLPPCVSWDIIT